MDPRDRMMLVERHKLCLGCLTSGHGRAAKSCPYKEEKVDACKVAHHHLLHTENNQGRKVQKGRPRDRCGARADEAGAST
jgi:hypothetical protein